MRLTKKALKLLQEEEIEALQQLPVEELIERDDTDEVEMDDTDKVEMDDTDTNEYKDLITGEWLTEPVVNSAGFIYNRATIEKCNEGKASWQEPTNRQDITRTLVDLPLLRSETLSVKQKLGVEVFSEPFITEQIELLKQAIQAPDETTPISQQQEIEEIKRLLHNFEAPSADTASDDFENYKDLLMTIESYKQSAGTVRCSLFFSPPPYVQALEQVRINIIEHIQEQQSTLEEHRAKRLEELPDEKSKQRSEQRNSLLRMMLCCFWMPCGSVFSLFGGCTDYKIWHEQGDYKGCRLQPGSAYASAPFSSIRSMHRAIGSAGDSIDAINEEERVLTL